MVESDIAGLLSRGFESKSAEDTLALASAYAKTLKPDAFIALSGDLGARQNGFCKRFGSRTWRWRRGKKPVF